MRSDGVESPDKNMDSHNDMTTEPGSSSSQTPGENIWQVLGLVSLLGLGVTARENSPWDSDTGGPTVTVGSLNAYYRVHRMNDPFPALG